MTSPSVVVSERRAALIAGAGYVVIFLLAIFANFTVMTGLVDPDSSAQSYANIAESETLFRVGIVSFLVVFALDVAIAWALYIVFRRHRRDVSLVTAWFRLIYTAFLGVALIFLLLVLQVVNRADDGAAFTTEQTHAQTGLLLDAFTYAWLIGLFCFGLHVVLLGYLVLSTRVAPRALGVILVVAGAAYMVDTLANVLLADYDSYANLFLVVVAVPSVIAEMWFALWLLARGGTKAPPVEESDDRDVQSALA